MHAAMAASGLLGLVAFLASVAVCRSQTSDCSYLSLLKHLNLLESQNLLAVTRPVKDWRTPTTVSIDMLLYGILQVEEKPQTLTSHIWTEMSWYNEFLTWEPSEFCGISDLTIPASLLWIPDISIQEDASDSSSIFPAPLLTVHSDGLVMRAARQRLTSTCKLNLRLFPFDTQKCLFTFSSFTADEETMTVESYRNDTALTKISEMFMVTQGEWALKSLVVSKHNVSKDAQTQSKVVYVVTIMRKPLLYVINLIVPLFYLLVLDLASFFIHTSRGEKLSFKITVLLSISVLLLILQDMLPSTEDMLPMIANYCVAIFALVGLSVLEAMLISFLLDLDSYCHSRSRKPAEVEIQLEDIQLTESEDKVLVKREKGSSHVDGPSGRQLLGQILAEVKALRQKAKSKDADKPCQSFYKVVAEIIDSVFFVLYLLTVIVFLTYMYIEWFVTSVTTE